MIVYARDADSHSIGYHWLQLYQLWRSVNSRGYNYIDVVCGIELPDRLENCGHCKGYISFYE